MLAQLALAQWAWAQLASAQWAAQWALAQWALAQWALAQWALAQWALAQWALAQWALAQVNIKTFIIALRVIGCLLNGKGGRQRGLPQRRRRVTLALHQLWAHHHLQHPWIWRMRRMRRSCRKFLQKLPLDQRWERTGVSWSRRRRSQRPSVAGRVGAASRCSLGKDRQTFAFYDVLAFEAYLGVGEMVPRSKHSIQGCLHVDDVLIAGDVISIICRVLHRVPEWCMLMQRLTWEKRTGDISTVAFITIYIALVLCVAKLRLWESALASSHLCLS